MVRVAIDVFSARLATGLGGYTRDITRNLIYYFPSIDWYLFGDSVSLGNIEEGINAERINLAGSKFGNDHFFPSIQERHIWRWLVGHHLKNYSFDLFYGPTYFLPFGNDLPPMVSTIPDVLFKTRPEDYPLTVRNFYHGVTKDACSRSHAITCISQETKNELYSFYPVDTEKVHVIYPGIDPVFCPSTEQEISRVRQKYNLPEKYILCIIGGYIGRKNIEKILAGYGEVRESFGVNTPSLVIISLNLSDYLDIKKQSLLHCQIIPYVMHEDLVGVISGATTLLHPTLAEGFGLPVLEAMACGVPVITSEIPIFIETTNGNAIFVDPDNASDIAKGIKKVLSPGESEKYVTSGIIRSKFFSWKRSAQQMMDVFKMLIE